MKKPIPIIALTVLLLSAVLSACRAESSESSSNNEELVKWAEMIVSVGTIQSSFSCPGIITAPEEAFRTCALPCREPEEKAVRNLYGRVFNPGETIFSDLKAVDHEKLVQITFKDQQAVLTLLNVDRLQVPVKIPYKQLRDINYLTEVTVSFEGKSLPASIESIGYQIDAKQIDVILGTTGAELLPGNEVTAEFILGERENCMFALKEAIGRDPDGSAFVYVQLSDGEYVRQNIVCGEEFTMQENGHEWTFIEILSGIRDGSRIRFQIAADDPSAYLYEEFFN